MRSLLNLNLRTVGLVDFRMVTMSLHGHDDLAEVFEKVHVKYSVIMLIDYFFCFLRSLCYYVDFMN